MHDGQPACQALAPNLLRDSGCHTLWMSMHNFMLFTSSGDLDVFDF